MAIPLNSLRDWLRYSSYSKIEIYKFHNMRNIDKLSGQRVVPNDQITYLGKTIESHLRGQ